MRNIRLFNGLLWALNGLLGAGIVVFVFQYFIFAQDSDLLKGFDPSHAGGPRTPERPVPQASDDVLKRFRNPIEKGGPATPLGGGPSSFRGALVGVMAGKDPKGGVAFLRLTTRGVETVAFPDEPILYEGKPVEELAGWKLSEVHKESAVFVNGNQRQVVVLESEPTKAGPGGARASGPGAPPGGARVLRSGQPYQPEGFKSQVLSSSDNQQVWAIDAQEIDWAMQNQERIIDQDFQVTPIPGGGLKIENVQAGSIGAARGLMAGDIVKNINGVPLSSLADLKNLAQNPSMRRQSSMRLTVERAGKPMVIVYQPLRQ